MAYNDNQYWQYPPYGFADAPWSHGALGADEQDTIIFSTAGKGPKGDTGEAAYFDDLTDAQLTKIYQQASAVANESEDAVVTTTATTTTIAIPFSDYDSSFDMLFVDVNGLDLAENVDYTISGSSIILTTALPSGQDVHFRRLSYTTIDGDKTVVNEMGRKDYLTVAEMVADKSLEAGDICHTLGFHAAGDGGAAWYEIKAHAVANSMDVLALVNGLFAELQITKAYVTPEMFGAYGDGTTDDYNSINKMFSAPAKVFNFSNKTYFMSNYVTLNLQDVKINGNGCSILCSNTSNFNFLGTSHDVEIDGIIFNTTYQSTSNANIVVQTTTTTDRYQAYNFKITNCSFNGSVFGILLNSVLDVEISNCKFYSFYFVPNDSAGGYAILIQSCWNVDIDNCYFEAGSYGRHYIYVSIDQRKPFNKINQNVSIKNCFFNSENMELIDSKFYSDITAAIVVRSTFNLEIDNCLLVQGTSLINFYDEDGPILASVNNCRNFQGRYIPYADSPNENRYAFIVNCSDNRTKINMHNCFLLDPIDNGGSKLGDCRINGGGCVEFSDSEILIEARITNPNYLIMSNVKINSHNSIAYDGTSKLKGKFKNIYGDVYYRFPRILSTGKVDFSMYESSAKEGFYFRADGTLEPPNHPVMPVEAEVISDKNCIRLTFPTLGERPLTTKYASLGAFSPKGYTVFTANSDSAGVQYDSNQVGLRIFSGTSLVSAYDGQVSW